jgi:hypothetical protein
VKNRIWIVLLVASLGVNIGFLLHWAWPKNVAQRTAGASFGWHAGPMKQHLGLSSVQARHMENERRQVLDQARPLQDALRQKRRELFLLLKGKDVRDSDLDATLAEIARLQAAIEKAFILHSLKVRRFFSPAQLRKYEGFLERGLCPGMLSASSCPTGTMGGRSMSRAGCGKEAGKKK